MIRNPDAVAAFEREYALQHLRHMDYLTALGIFTGLWLEARQLHPGFTQEWQAGLDADFAIARAVNGLPPA